MGEQRTRVSQLFREVVFWVAALVEFALVIVVLALQVSVSPVLTGSMGEALPVGSVAITAQVPTQSLTADDVVRLPLPEQPGNEYVHRITETRPSSQGVVVLTKGDSNLNADPWRVVIVSPHTPLVIAHIPAVGYLHNLVAARWIQYLIIACIGALLVLTAFRAVERHRQAKR